MIKIARALPILFALLATTAATDPAVAKATCAKPSACTKLRGAMLDNSTASDLAIGANTENTAVPNGNAGELFSISVDGEHIAGTPVPKDIQRKTDLGLDAVDIQVKYDGLDVKPMLNVSTYPVRRAYAPGEKVQFLASSNYPGWIARQQILVYEDDGFSAVKPVATIPVTPEGAAVWRMPKSGAANLTYVLRVYDDEGRFDETKPLSLSRTEKQLEQHEPQDGGIAPGYSEDRTAVRNIPVFGGAVTVYGKNVPNGEGVAVMGDRIPVDEEGAFVVQRILPPGDHSITVELAGKKGSDLSFNRSINIPSSDWFYVALADLTVGQRFASQNIVDVRPGEFPGTYTKGRAAFYLKGKIQGKYLLTASADTGEAPLGDLLKGWDAKDPKQFLRRFNPEDFYPVYGDDSTLTEDAPTRGKFYVRFAKGDSHVMWGNFKTEIRGTELLRNERALYGASGVYKSEDTVASGERSSELHVYAAQPGTLPQRDVLRGTGGSAYFLKHQDITAGSETISVEVRDPVSNQLLSRRQLVYGKDYEIDYIQGVVLLKQPLSSFASAGFIRDGGNEVYLVANYEYSPAAGNADGYVYGGRGQQWLGDHVRVGFTGAIEKTGGADQRLIGADILFRHSDQTYAEAEIASSSGPGFGISQSTDGGLTITDKGTSGLAGVDALAYRAHGHLAVQDIAPAAKGDIDLYFARKEKGFSSLTEQITDSRTEWGAKGDLELTPGVTAKLAYSASQTDSGSKDTALEAAVSEQLGGGWSLTQGVKHIDRSQPAGTYNGTRTDIGAQLQYNFDEHDFLYVFGQWTAATSGTVGRNDRVGVGGKTALTEKVDLAAEASTGSRGFGAKARIEYSPTADDHYYLGYTLDPDREFSNGYMASLQGDDLGTIVSGARHSYNKTLSAYAEDSFDIFGVKRSLAQTYGVTYTPDAVWTVNGAIQAGHIWDNTVNPTTLVKNSDFDRKAFSATVGYHPSEKVDASAKAEVRFDNSDDHTRDLTAYYLAGRFGYGLDDNWRAIGHVDAVFSDASQTTRNSAYFEGAFGFAYRPTDNDRFNALLKYTYLYDLPGVDQVSIGGVQQRTHIFNADASYDISQIITLGAKYGFRIGDTKPRDGSADWTSSSAHLGVVRADLHIVKEWDAVLEGRALWSPEAQSTNLGAIAAVYHHFNDNFSLGVGYNFGNFSDDLRKQSIDEHGVFINAVGKF